MSRDIDATRAERENTLCMYEPQVLPLGQTLTHLSTAPPKRGRVGLHYSTPAKNGSHLPRVYFKTSSAHDTQAGRGSSSSVEGKGHQIHLIRVRSLHVTSRHIITSHPETTTTNYLPLTFRVDRLESTVQYVVSERGHACFDT